MSSRVQCGIRCVETEESSGFTMVTYSNGSLECRLQKNIDKSGACVPDGGVNSYQYIKVG